MPRSPEGTMLLAPPIPGTETEPRTCKEKRNVPDHLIDWQDLSVSGQLTDGSI